MSSTPHHKTAAEQEEGGWQPIDTAPRDGTPFLGVSESGTVRYFLWREFDEDDQKDGYPWRFADTTYDHFIEENGYPFEFGPTHWQPLPAPPHPSLPEQGEQNT